MKIRTYVVDGPTNAETAIEVIISSMVWWRVWATLFLMTLPLWVGILVFVNIGGFSAVVATYLANILIQEQRMKLNPKYELTKNY